MSPENESAMRLKKKAIVEFPPLAGMLVLLKCDAVCALCYQKGSFVGPTTAAEMQKFCIQKLKEMGVPRPIGWLMTRGIPRLSRWKS